MPSPRPVGSITRGTTNPNRLRRVDRWLLGTHRRLLTSGPAPMLVDLGYGATGTTTAEWHARVRAVRADAQVVGLEIDPDRVEAARPMSRPGLTFARGGFEVPLQGGGTARVIRALNVLRQYDEGEVPAAWATLRDRLDPDGVVIDGTCDELGRLGSWVTLGREGPRTLTLSWRVRELAVDRPPSVVAERLPKALIHRNVPGEPVHRLLADLDEAWSRAAGWAPYGARQRFLAAVDTLAAQHAVIGGRERWRLGEVTVPWTLVAPSGGPGETGRPEAGQRE